MLFRSVFSQFKQSGTSGQLVPVCLPEDDEYQTNIDTITKISHRTIQLMNAAKLPLPHGTTASSLPILMQSIGSIMLSTSDKDTASQINLITVCCDEVNAARAKDSATQPDRKSTRLNSSHGYISYAVFCLKKNKNKKKKKKNNSAAILPHSELLSSA